MELPLLQFLSKRSVIICYDLLLLQILALFDALVFKDRMAVAAASQKSSLWDVAAMRATLVCREWYF